MTKTGDTMLTNIHGVAVKAAAAVTKIPLLRTGNRRVTAVDTQVSWENRAVPQKALCKAVMNGRSPPDHHLSPSSSESHTWIATESEPGGSSSAHTFV